jgi:SAM-dependent methyltransferase
MTQNIDYLSGATVSPEKIRWLENDAPQIRGNALDLGCGAGLYSKWLSDRGWMVDAIDVNQSPTIKNVRVSVCDLEVGLNFPDAHFDFLMAWDILEHLANEEKMWGEIARVLRPGGMIMGSVPHGSDQRLYPYNLAFKHHIDKTHKREYNEEHIRTRMEKVGIALKATELVGPVSPQFLSEFVAFKALRRPVALTIGAFRRLGFLTFQEFYADVFFCGKKQ